MKGHLKGSLYSNPFNFNYKCFLRSLYLHGVIEKFANGDGKRGALDTSTHTKGERKIGKLN